MAGSKLIVDLSGTPANSRSQRVTSSSPLHNVKTISKTTRTRSRSSLRHATSIKDSEDDLTDDFPGSSMIESSTKKDGPKETTSSGSRVSMSSVSTMNDSAPSSGYSTPATSVGATPATNAASTTTPSMTRRGRRQASSITSQLPPTAINAFARARTLRNSEFALNPTSTKRKRGSLADLEDEDDDSDDDNSPDAQLARALQEQENRNVNTMVDDPVEDLPPRRAKRALRPLRPKADYIEFSDDESDTKAVVSKKPPKRAKYAIPDSDESEFFDETDDEEALDLKSSGRKSQRTIPIGLTPMNGSDKPAAKNSGNGVTPGFGSAQLHVSMYDQHLNTSATPKEERKSFAAGLAAAFTRESTEVSTPSDYYGLGQMPLTESDDLSSLTGISDTESDNVPAPANSWISRRMRQRMNRGETRMDRRARLDRERLEAHHPEVLSMWKELETMPHIKKEKAEQPTNISRELKPFQLEGLAWMKEMEKTKWGGGLLGDEMGMGKTIQAVSLIMSDYPASSPSLVLIPPVALMQWQQEIGDYTDGTLKTFVFHGTNQKTKGITVKALKNYDVILMSYNSLESMFRHQEKGRKRNDEMHFEKSVIHQIHFHRVILDEAHNIKTRSTGSAKACFALKADHKWCLSGTPLQNRIGEFFSLVRFLDIRPFACYMCKQCSCTTLEWSMNEDNRCTGCSHSGMQHVSVFNHELLNPIQKYGNKGKGKEAFAKLRLLTDRFMLRRVKRDHSAAMELPAKEIYVDRHFFGEEENDFAASIMNSGTRKFETYVAQGVLLNNYANIFGLIMQMRQVANHPDLILKKNGDGGQNVLVCCICDETAEDAIRSSCRHEFCRACAKNYLKSSTDTNSQPDCPRCHIPLSIDLEQPEIEQNEEYVKKSSIINRIKMENWTSSSKIEALVYDIHSLRSHNSSTKSIVFSGFTTMLQLVEWRLRRAGITTVMLDGSMTPAQRQGSINAFMTNPDIECFLVSLKAGGVALNLTEASHVFIVDPWWNPAAEWQSADRCHRIGQSRPCTITRLCIEDSVESRMVLLQEKKANMINSTINNDESAMESLTPEDMQFLFRGT